MYIYKHALIVFVAFGIRGASTTGTARLCGRHTRVHVLCLTFLRGGIFVLSTMVSFVVQKVLINAQQALLLAEPTGIPSSHKVEQISTLESFQPIGRGLQMTHARQGGFQL